MPTHPYRSVSGARVPGTTTVIGQNLGWNKDVLVRWANRQGLEGVDTQQRLRGAGDVGDAVHAAIEAHIYGGAPVLLTLEGASAYDAFLAWSRQTQGEIVATELWGVDEEYQTGWCLDALRVEEGGLSLVDWKTSGGTYAEHLIQVAAYTVFVEKKLSEWGAEPLAGEGAWERPVDWPPAGMRLTGAHVCRFDKVTGGFSHKFWPRAALDVGWRAFTWLRALHEVRREIESRVR